MDESLHNYYNVYINSVASELKDRYAGVMATLHT